MKCLRCTLRRLALAWDRRTKRPSAQQLEQLHARVARRMSYRVRRDDIGQHEAWKRRVSREFARELRKRGWLAEEGYSDNSWAHPRNA